MPDGAPAANQVFDYVMKRWITPGIPAWIEPRHSPFEGRRMRIDQQRFKYIDIDRAARVQQKVSQPIETIRVGDAPSQQAASDVAIAIPHASLSDSGPLCRLLDR